MQIGKTFKKKIPLIKTYSIKIKDKNPTNSTSSLRRTNSQIINDNNNIYEDISTHRTKSLRHTSLDNVLYDEQIKYNVEPSKNKNKSYIINKSSISHEDQNDSTPENISVPQKIDELKKYKNLCENVIKELNSNNSKDISSSYNSKNKFNKTVSDKSTYNKYIYTIRSKLSHSNISDNICNYEDISARNFQTKKIFNY